MAEYVHQTLEEMIPELEEMSRVGLFTVKETKTIMKKREGHEYKLRQLTKTKESFLNYIQYETKLLELLKLRRKKIGQENLKKGIEKSIADRIHSLYRMLTTRFKECVEFWEMHIDFSKQMNEKAYVTRLYEQALKLHARNEDLWVKAARWENSPEGNGNSQQARTVLLKGQRTNPDSEIIFLQMFLFELQLGRQVAKRKLVLGLAEETEEKQEEEKVCEPEFKLAEIVYRNGLELFPDRPDVHLKMFHLSCAVDEASRLQHKIASDLQYTYPDTPQVWNALALRHLNNIKNSSKGEASEMLARCVKVYENTLENLPTEEMWTLALTGLLNLLTLREATHCGWLLPKILSLFERSLQLGTISAELGTDLVELLLELGMTDDLPEVTSRLTDLHPRSADLWMTRMSREVKHAGKDVEAVLAAALKTVPAEESWPLWEFALNFCAAQKPEALEGLMERACRSVCPQVCLPAREWSLHWTYRQGGLKGLRNVYKSLRVMRPVSVGFYQIYIKIEAAQLEPDVKRLRSAFEEACAHFGATDTDLWLNYIQMEREVGGTDSQGGVVYERAGRSLQPDLRELFIRKHTLMGVVA
ncbi:hypothetical protein EGW08_003825 [Elysia chlorotica]|uniref:U3 small nucleolar RNA-associated protein 6 homolog n=1 Tax=Elysia chlorotica TaxID=188477 RepID=A0A3S1HY43_ELYCH|nr:hypothetical protein EGW08_003825 [Elysia chlorotica]